MRGARYLAAALIIAALSVAPLGAFTLEPMSTLLAPAGGGSIATFKIKNDGTERIAIKLSVLTRKVSPDGKEENSPAGNLFAIYPARVLVEPGATSSVKVQWKGRADLSSEQCFRLMAEQISLASGDEEGSGIHLLFRYIASIYVGKAGFEPKLEVSARGGLGPKGEKGFLIEITNSGIRHVVALKAKVELEVDGGQPIVLEGDSLGNLNGANYLPGQPRQLFIESDQAIPERPYAASLIYEGEY